MTWVCVLNVFFFIYQSLESTWKYAGTPERWGERESHHQLLIHHQCFRQNVAGSGGGGNVVRGLILILMPFNPRVKLKRRAPVLSRSKLGCVWDIDMKCNKKRPMIYHWPLSLREYGEGSWGLKRKNKDVTSLDAYLMSLARFHLIITHISPWNFNVFPVVIFVVAKTSVTDMMKWKRQPLGICSMSECVFY